MKNIWVDGYEANVEQRLGSSQVAFELIKNIERLDFKNNYTVLLPDKPLEDLPKEREGFKYKILKPKRLWTRIALPLAFFFVKNKPDVIFSPTHYIPRFAPKGLKRVGMVFDLSFLHFPSLFGKKDLWQLTNWTKFTVENAEHIITISKSTKLDLIKNYELNKDKITVSYPGFDAVVFHKVSNENRMQQVLNKYQIEEDFIIFVGTIQPRKNLVRLIEIVSRIEDLKLVVVGKTSGEGRAGWMYEDILKRPSELGVKERVIFTGFVPSGDLPYLISGSVAYINPSLWEGFGIPVVEAMACGVPVLVSNVSSLPEVVGKAGLMFDPNKIDQIEQAIRTIYSDKKLRLKLAKLSLLQAKKFSWKKMAKDVIKVLENV